MAALSSRLSATLPPPQYSVTHKLAKDAVHPIDELIEEDIKQFLLNY